MVLLPPLKGLSRYWVDSKKYPSADIPFLGAEYIGCDRHRVGYGGQGLGSIVTQPPACSGAGGDDVGGPFVGTPRDVSGAGRETAFGIAAYRVRWWAGFGGVARPCQPAYHSAMAPLRTVTGSVVSQGLRLVVQSRLRWT
jgi:hypothetical protein